MGKLRMIRAAAVIGLAGASAVHAAWAKGSSFPAADEGKLADAVIGRTSMPSALACTAVATLLGSAAALVAGAPAPRGKRRLGVATVSAALLSRGALGLTGKTPVASERFRSLDRRLYGPVCLALGAASLTGLRKRW